MTDYERHLSLIRDSISDIQIIHDYIGKYQSGQVTFFAQKVHNRGLEIRNAYPYNENIRRLHNLISNNMAVLTNNWFLIDSGINKGFHRQKCYNARSELIELRVEVESII